MQVVLTCLKELGFVYEEETDDHDVLRSLFFMHSDSFKVWRTFPEIMIMDATYKTNVYNMPYFEIVGATSTGQTFLIASCFMYNEKEPTYVWVLECLKRRLVTGMRVRVIITDREQALINASEYVFPEAKLQLCRFHIHQNLEKHVKKGGVDLEFLPNVSGWWRNVVNNSLTEDQYNTNLENFRNNVAMFPGIQILIIVILEDHDMDTYVLICRVVQVYGAQLVIR